MVHPIYEDHPFERRSPGRKFLERRLEVLDLVLALVVFVLVAFLLA